MAGRLVDEDRARRLGPGAGPVRPAPHRHPFHGNRSGASLGAGSQYTSIAYTTALVEAGIAPSIGSVGDALDNALMESTIGLYKTELIDRHQRSWAGPQQVETATADWVHWFNTRRRRSSIDYLPPVTYEQLYRQQTSTPTGEAA